MEKIIHPCLFHSLTVQGQDSIEEGIECITIILYYGYRDKPISQEMWKLFPWLLFMCAGSDGDEEAGFGFAYINQIAIAIKNFISRDPEGMMRKGEIQGQSHAALVYHFI